MEIRRQPNVPKEKKLQPYNSIPNKNIHQHWR